MALVFLITITGCADGTANFANPAATDAPVAPEAPQEPELPADDDVWELKQYVDDFGDPTDNTYMVASFEGTFSNNATTDSYLDVVMLYDNNPGSHFGIRLIEYGSIHASFSGSVTVKIKVNDTITTGTIDRQLIIGDVIYIDSKNEDLRKNIYLALKNGDDVRFVITSNIAKYSFTVTGGNFDVLVEELNQALLNQSKGN